MNVIKCELRGAVSSETVDWAIFISRLVLVEMLFGAGNDFIAEVSEMRGGRGESDAERDAQGGGVVVDVRSDAELLGFDDEVVPVGWVEEKLGEVVEVGGGDGTRRGGRGRGAEGGVRG